MDETPQLDQRAQVIFKALVERYIREGQPIGSKTLAFDAGLTLSSATVRHILANLEEQGLLRSPHTSAGRVPTNRGYRLFVDSLLTTQPLSNQEVSNVKKKLLPLMDTPQLLDNASRLLTHITSLTALVTVPKQKQVLLTHIEFLPLTHNSVLVILVLNDREVQNRLIHTERVFSNAELQEASNYLNGHFAGKPFAQLKQFIKKKMRQDKQAIDQLMEAAIRVSGSASQEVVVSGQNHLIDYIENNDMNRLRDLFSAFSQKRDLLHLLDQCLQTQGVQLFIGEESGYAPLDQCTLVGSPYTVDGQIVGVLAVVGPTRMAYERIIPIVDITAKLLSVALNQNN